MKDEPAERRAAEACALITTLAIAGQARWSLDRTGSVLDAPLTNYLYVERAHLLLVPTSRELAEEMATVGYAVRQARSDALIVRASDRRSDRLELALGRWSLAGPHWHAPMTLWRRQDPPLWLVPNPYHSSVRHECFELQDALLRSRPAPWVDLHDHRTGLARAAAWLARVAGPL